MRNRRTPLRLRFAIMSAALLVALSVGLVLFINTMAVATVPTTEQHSLPIQIQSSSDWRPGQPTYTPLIVDDPSLQPLSPASVSEIRESVLGQLQITSFIGLGLVVLLGAAGAYWMAGRALRPLSQVSRAASRISADTLDTRLGLQAPDDELKELAEAFDTMLDRLQRSFDQQGRFVSNAAHELRTPLTTLRTNIEVTYSDPDATAEDYREMVPVLQRTLTRLEQLVADLLVMATAEKSLAHEDVVLKPLV
ncbi:MAG: HAMP domain-containing protein, partial [Chloroflexota bacterium]|nr:HAMP domain-containing protein [Chloroflexota bacterium]